MTHSAPGAFRRLLEAAVRSGDSEALGLLLDRVALNSFQKPCAAGPEHKERLDAALALLGSAAFHAMPGASRALLFFQSEWGAMTEPQRDRLFRSVEAHFDRYADPDAAMVQADLLGGFFCSARSLDLLRRFAAPRRGPGCAAALHGLEIFAKTTKDPNLYATARSVITAASEGG